jgi:VWFA-related protein
MILAYMKGLRLVQDFTGDRNLLVSRLNALLDDRETLDSEALEEPSNMVTVAENLPRKVEALAFALREEARIRGSLEALASVMPRLAGLRGRKALVLFSDMLREEPGAQYLTMLGTTPRSEGIDVLPEILRVTREANAAGVSIYTVHAAGLDEHPVRQMVGGYATSQFRSQETGAPNEDALLVADMVTNGAGTASSSAIGLQATLAVETGGRALHRTNDIAGILRSAQQDLSCYYLLGYSHAGPGDDSQHHVVLRLKEAPGRPGGLTVRYRPSFTDRSASSRRDRVLRSALEVPELYQALPVALEAYALAPRESAREVLIKAIVPLDQLSLIPAGEAHEGRVEIRGIVSRDHETACIFVQDIAIRRRTEGRLVYQTGCLLPPGTYQLTVALLDRGGTQVGAHRAPLRLEPMGGASQASLGEVHLWARDTEALVVTTGAADIGLADRAGSGDFLLRSERRLAADQAGVLSFLYCPAAGIDASAVRPIAIQLRVFSGPQVVSDDEVRITGPSESGGSICHEIRRNLPPHSLPAGHYTLDIVARGTGSPLSRRADFAVE